MSLLKVDGLRKTFGGVHAIEALDFTITDGPVHAVIGPNGAGKTTLFNLITGIYQPNEGDIRLQDESIVRRQPHELARQGLSRTFQNLQVCMNMSAVENVMLGKHLQLRSGFLATLLRSPGIVNGDRTCREQAVTMMETVGLSKYIHSDASAMPYGALKRLEIARALAADPRLLLLDEPAAGLNPRETEDIRDLIRQITKNKITVVLVEHDMKLVMDTAQHIIVLNYGRKLAEGSPQEIKSNPDVIAAYLGGQEKHSSTP